MPNPITGAPGLRDLPRTLFGDPFRIQSADVDSGVLSARTQGQIGRNQTGSTIPAGALVAITGWSAPLTNFPNGLALLSLAAATGRYLGAVFIALAAIPNNGNGIIGKQFFVSGLNTNAATVGDAVYLDSAVPGGFVLTNPPATGSYYQVVGRVVTKNAATGMIDLNLESGVPLAPDAFRQTTMLPTIGTAAATYAQGVNVLRAGVLAAVRLTFEAALAQSDTNFITFQLNNRAAGAGNTPLLTTSPAGVNTTKTTGGKAIVQYTDYGVTGVAGPINLALNDWLDFTAIVTGTLAGAVTGGSLELVIQNT